mgnify:CR=1 FL=1
MGNINDFIILVVIRQRVQERALFLCENLNNIYGEFPTIFQQNCTTSYTKEHGQISGFYDIIRYSKVFVLYRGIYM